ncbi:DUF559 domain-containing protein [[Mycobacterium] burgundiense]|uniref:DUF559 domain-containing protein n=1 Tax=[Mycobacterium] burgundiense TaxID=3064286 RepID=A0ABN9NM60_9MYCO|nr:DUF559 domain-containing protein [Mycolicibacterium sp. MU0053]CAJ1507280.1 DUF559 domain-containing protein [Mycolicibacterium sp. MU0053]
MLNEYLRSQDGVITLGQAKRCGLSEDAVHRRVRTKDWLRCARGVYFVDDRPFTAAARIRVGVWAHGPRAVASGLAAAWWHGLVTEAPELVEVTVPRSSHGRSRPGTRLRRRDLRANDVVERRRLLVTSLPLTVVEAVARRGGGARVMDTALQRHTELRQLWRAHLNNKGRYGAPRARRMLQAAGNGARSQAEREFVRVVDLAGITGWIANYPVGGYVVDFAFPEAKVAVEIDGWAFHQDQNTFQSDRRRQNSLALKGWQILRFTWQDLMERPERVVAELRAAISAR